MDVELIKRGETCIMTSFTRSSYVNSKVGLTLTVKTHPNVEDMMRGMGTATPIDVSTLGRHWVQKGKDPLLVYDLTVAECMGGLGNAPHLYRLDRPGYPMWDFDQGLRYNVINMSFLRLVGISEGSGVSFGVRGVISYDHVKQVAAAVENASRAFYMSYMKPIDVTVVVSTQEVEG